MATNPFDTNVQPVQQSAGSFRVQEEAPVQTQTFEPLISSFNKYIGAEVDQKMQERATELETQGAIDISFNNAKIEDLKNNEFTTEAYARGMRAMGAKTAVSSTVTDYYNSLSDPEIQRMTPEDMQGHLQDLAKSAGNSGDAEMDRMVLSQLANQIPELAAKHTELHRKRLEDDGYQEGHSYVTQGYQQVAAQVNQGVITEEEATGFKTEVFDSAMEYMYTTDQKRALLSHSLVTALNSKDLDTYEELNKRIGSLGGLRPKQEIAVQRAYNSLQSEISKNKTFTDTVRMAELSINASNINYSTEEFYADLEAAQRDGVISYTKAASLIEKRVEAEIQDAKITKAGNKLMDGNSALLDTLSGPDQQTALNRSYGAIGDRLEYLGYSGDELELNHQLAWMQLLGSNPTVVHAPTAKRYSDSVNSVFGGQDFSEDAKNDVIALYELSKTNPRFLANYVTDSTMRQNILNYGGRMQLSADNLSKLIQRDKQASSQPTLTKEQGIEIEKLLQEYRVDYEGRTSFGFFESAPDRLAASYSLNEIQRVATANLRSGVYVNAEAAFDAARIELEENTVDILGHSVPQGSVPISKRMGVTDVTPEQAIFNWSNHLSNEMVLPDGHTRFLNFDSVNGTVGIIEVSDEGQYTAVVTKTFGEIGEWQNTKGREIASAEEDYQEYLLTTEEGKAKADNARKVSEAEAYRGSPMEHNIRANVSFGAKPLHGKAAIKAVEDIHGPLNPIEKRIVEEEGFSRSGYKDDKGVVTKGVGQTGKYLGMPFKEVAKAFKDKTKQRVKGFDKLPTNLQAELVQLTYRGDLSTDHKWLKLFNKGEYKAASLELLKHEEYSERKGKGDDGVTRRLEAAARAIANYANK